MAIAFSLAGLFIIILGLLIYLLKYRVIRWFINRNTVNKIPGPHSYYIIGNVFDYLGDSGKYFYFDNAVLKL